MGINSRTGETKIIKTGFGDNIVLRASALADAR
jgi:hypothetical protein